MADVITRLKVESSEYDSKIQRAAKGIQHLEDATRRAGKTMADASEEEVNFVKNLGQMETISKDATGSIVEMTKAFTNLSIQYKHLSDQEKQSAFGQALAASLNQLQTRIRDGKSEIAGIEGELSGLGNVADALGSKLGIPVSALTGVGAAAAAAGAALKVAKDAIMATEDGVDEWGKTVEGAKGAYSVFLDTLNNGNWSNFFSNLNAAINGASKLYDEMDRLSSIKANNAAAIAREQATIQELRLRQQKGENVTKELRDAEERLRNLQKQSVDQGKLVGKEQMKQAITNSVNSIKGNGAGIFGINIRKDTTAKVSEAQIDAAIEEVLNEGQAAMDKYAKLFKDLQKKGTKEVTNYSQGGQAYKTYEFDITKLSAEEQAMYKLSKAITDTESKLGEGINTYAQALQEGASATREQFQTERFAQKGEKQRDAEAKEAAKPQTKAQEKVDKALEDYATTMNIATIRKEAGLDDEEKYKENELRAHEQLFNAYTEAYNLYADPKYKEAFDKEATEILGLAKVVKELKDEKEAQKQADRELEQAERERARQIKQLDTSILSGLTNTAKKAGWTTADLGTTGIKTQIDAGVDISEDTWKEFETKLNERLKELHMDPIQINFETGSIETPVQAAKQTADAWQNAVAAVNNVGSALQQLEDPAAKVSGIVMQAVANIALGFAQAAASPATGAAGVFGWIAAATAGLATMVSTIASIKSVTKGYASGGIVEGTSYSGDNIVARLNAGEGVLTAQGVQNAAAMANNSNPLGNLALSMDLKGEDIQICLDNNRMRRGR